MARLAPASDPGALSPEARRVYEAIERNRGYVRGPIAVVLPHSPEVAARLDELGAALRFESTLTRAQVELATLVAARVVGADYVWASHVPAAEKAGVRAEAIAAVDSRGPLDGLSEDEAVVVGFARELLEERRISPDTYDRTRGRFGERGLLELTTLLGFYQMVASVIAVAELEPAPGRPRLSR